MDDSKGMALCDICLESVPFFTLHRHRIEKHSEILKEERAAGLRLLWITGPTGAGFLVVFFLALRARAAWTWPLIFVALSAAVVAAILGSSRELRRLSTVYASTFATCRVCLAKVQWKDLASHYRSLHPATRTIAVRSLVASVATIAILVAGIAYLDATGPPFGSTEALFVGLAAFAILLGFVGVSSRAWRRHLRQARGDWSREPTRRR